MTDPTQEQRGVSGPRCKCGHPYLMHNNCEDTACSTLVKGDFCECENYEPVEQGVSMEPELPPLNELKIRIAADRSVWGKDWGRHSETVSQREAQLLAALNEVHDLKEERSKLSTRIDEYELAETKAVEELARVRELLKEYRRLHIYSRRPCVESATCTTCKEADALLAPKPLDTNEGGE